MADRSKKKKKDKRRNLDEPPTKEEKAIATHVRFNCPTKSTMFHGEEVHYFTASKAVDCLMESKWATGKKKTTVILTNRASCVNYMQCLQEKGLFFRAKKLVPKKKDKDKDKEKQSEKEGEKKEKGAGDSKDESTSKITDSPAVSKSPKKKKKNTTAEDTEEEGKKTDKDKDSKSDKKDEEDGSSSKKKKKIKLEFHEEQIFRDSNDVYVWHFEPTSWTKFIIGLLIVIGSIGVCLFPLWPPWVRLGIYYLSVVAMVFVGFLVSLIVLRSIVFGIVWLVSFGKHHLWILPNLTEDCGFFESFLPAYSYKYVPGDGKTDDEAEGSEKTAEEKKKEKEKNSDAEEDENPNAEESSGDHKQDGEEDQNTNSDEENQDDQNMDDYEDEAEGPDNSENDENSGLRQRKKRNRPRRDDGFELVDQPNGDED